MKTVSRVLDILFIEIGDIHGGDVLVYAGKDVGSVECKYSVDFKICWCGVLIIGYGDVNYISYDTIDMDCDIDHPWISLNLEGIILTYDW